MLYNNNNRNVVMLYVYLYNTGTAIWETAKGTSGQTDKFEDKSTWNQKVAGNNDPNVWNGEGTKGKDNRLWDDVPSNTDQENL